MKLKLNIERKQRYLIQSVLSSVFVLVVAQKYLNLAFWQVALIALVLVISGSLVSHYPNIKKENLLTSILMPLGVLSGALLSLHFFPNLGLPFKLIVITFFGLMYYLVLLADNIFLVVHDREEVIPLYRVAVTWSQILQVVVAIPLFAGIFKIGTTSFLQSFIISVIAFLFTYYQLRIYQFDADAKRTGVGEELYLCFTSFFFIFSTSFAVSFFPGEAFLRALFAASVLMFLLSYISGYLKNEITRKMVIGYFAIMLVFLAFLLVFIP